MKPKTCPAPEVLRDLGLGRLPEVLLETIGGHLDRCAACRRAAAAPSCAADPLGAVLRRAGGSPARDEGLCRAAALVDQLDRLERLEHPTADRSPEPTAVTPVPPTEVGPYRLLREVASGGMGVVYEAEDTQLQRRVALKMMKPTCAADASARHRFLREARAAAQLKDDHIVTIHDVGEAGGRPYLVMEFLGGPTLGARLARAQRLPVAQALQIAIQVAQGLTVAHRHGVIHRDIKPDNIWVGESAVRVKILDFGLARSQSGDPGLTHDGLLIGTPAYMAPEQARAGARVDARSDLFSLGCVLYRALTGRVPFAGTDTMSTLMSLATRRPVAPHEIEPAVPPDLSGYVVKLLEKNPGDRPGSAEEVVRALRAVEAGLRPPPARKRRRALVASAALVLAGLLGLAVPWRPRAADTVPESTADTAEALPPAPPDTPPLAVAPFTSAQALELQTAWARHLGARVEVPNSLHIPMRLLPPGEFSMGAAPAELDELLAAFGKKCGPERVLACGPRHRVRLSRPIYMSAILVTQSNYEELTGRNPSHHTVERGVNDRFGGRFNARYPVESVTWFDAVEFCNRLSAKEGLPPFYARTGDLVTCSTGPGYRLPTEAEWEYACRAGTATRFAHGDDPAVLTEYAWFHQGTPLGVGMLKPNPFGLYDTVGNVNVWCQDWYDPGAYRSRKGALTTDPRGPDAGTERVQRGAFYGNAALALHSSRRWSVAPNLARVNLGFRVVRDLPR